MYLSQINYTVLESKDEIRDLAKEYIDKGVLTPKSYDDANHIATATVNGCDLIVSWNFKHIVKYKTFMGVNGINKFYGYQEISLISPYELVEEED